LLPDGEDEPGGPTELDADEDMVELSSTAVVAVVEMDDEREVGVNVVKDFGIWVSEDVKSGRGCLASYPPVNGLLSAADCKKGLFT